MKKTAHLSLFIMIFIAWCSHAYAQSHNIIEDQTKLLTALQKNDYEIDPEAKAITLYEEGSCNYIYASYDLKIERIIKILSDDAANNLSEITIPYKNISKIKAEAFNQVNGIISKTTLDNKAIINDNVTNGYNISKFNIPNVRKGTIIHYSYSVHVQGSYYIPEWYFQGDYPTLFSKYIFNCSPQYYVNKILRINSKLTRVFTENDLGKYEASQLDNGIGFHTTSWVRQNVPAFKKEPFSINGKNVKERVKILITGVIQSAQYTGLVEGLYNNWTDYCEKFYINNEAFAGQLFHPNNFLNMVVKSITKDDTSKLAKAHSIYNYVRQNFHKVPETQNGLSDIRNVFKTQTGSLAGINLLFVAMCKNAGLDCELIALSTKSSELLNSAMPDPPKINYIAAVFSDRGTKYYLDASEKNLPFGYLWPECYTGFAPMITRNGGSVDLNPDNVKEKSNYVISISPTAKNDALLIKIDHRFGVYSGMATRNKWDNDINKIRKDIEKLQLENSFQSSLDTFIVKNLNNPDLPLDLHFELKFSIDPNVSTIYLNPFFLKFFDYNPFFAKSRTYPIQLDYNQDLNYTINIKLPPNYKIDEYPKSSSIKINDAGQMTFTNLANLDTATQVLSLSSKFNTSATYFPETEYAGISMIFQKIVEEQNKSLVIKKVE